MLGNYGPAVVPRSKKKSVPRGRPVSNTGSSSSKKSDENEEDRNDGSDSSSSGDRSLSPPRSAAVTAAARSPPLSASSGSRSEFFGDGDGGDGDGASPSRPDSSSSSSSSSPSSDDDNTPFLLPYQIAAKATRSRLIASKYRTSVSPPSGASLLPPRLPFSKYTLKTPTPFAALQSIDTLLKLLLKWRYVRLDEYPLNWEVPVAPWQGREDRLQSAEREREFAERQLMSHAEYETVDLEKHRNAHLLKGRVFCQKVAGWMLNKCFDAAFRIVDDRVREKIERKRMSGADVLSKVFEKHYREEQLQKKRRFLDSKRLAYNKWVVKEKAAIHEVEHFETLSKKSIDWYCDFHDCEHRNTVLLSSCGACGRKRDPALDEPSNPQYARRQARRKVIERTEDLAAAMADIQAIDEALKGGDVKTVVRRAAEGRRSSKVAGAAFEAMGALYLSGQSSQVLQLDGLGLLGEAMGRFAGDVIVQRVAFKLLLNICLGEGGAGGRAAIVRAKDTIPAIVDAMVNFPYDSIVQWTGAQIFFWLVCSGVGGADSVTEPGGLTREDIDCLTRLHRCGGVKTLQSLLELRKSWAAKPRFRKRVKSAVDILSRFDRKNSRRSSDLRLRGLSGGGGDDDDDDWYISDAEVSTSRTDLQSEMNAQLSAADIEELSEDEEDLAIDRRIRGNITNLLVKRGWRIGRHPFVPECMDSLFKSQTEFDLHRLDDFTKLYVPSLPNSRAASRASSRGAAGNEQKQHLDIADLVPSAGSAPPSRMFGSPFYLPINPNIQENERPSSRDRPPPVPSQWAEEEDRSRFGSPITTTPPRSATRIQSPAVKPPPFVVGGSGAVRVGSSQSASLTKRLTESRGNSRSGSRGGSRGGEGSAGESEGEFHHQFKGVKSKRIPSPGFTQQQQQQQQQQPTMPMMPLSPTLSSTIDGVPRSPMNSGGGAEVRRSPLSSPFGGRGLPVLPAPSSPQNATGSPLFFESLGSPTADTPPKGGATRVAVAAVATVPRCL